MPCIAKFQQENDFHSVFYLWLSFSLILFAFVWWPAPYSNKVFLKRKDYQGGFVR